MDTPTRLRVLRAERNWSQGEVARRAGLSHSRYWRIEHGLQSMSPEDRACLARAFELSEDVAFPEPAEVR